MSYAQGSTIAASDYNGFTGGQDLTVAFASAAAATQKASALLGVGYGDRGYGQTTPSLPAKSFPLATSHKMTSDLLLYPVSNISKLSTGISNTKIICPAP